MKTERNAGIMAQWNNGMKNLSANVFVICVLIGLSSTSLAQSYPGSFARIGLTAKGMAMGNSIMAMTTGDVYTYYIPALASFQDGRNVGLSVALMSLNRQLNILTYTQSLKPDAGISAGIINATVSNIDGRDADGVHTTDMSTSENLFYFSFSNQFARGFSVGISLKAYYYSLYSGISATSVGFDLGMLYKFTDFLSVGAAVTDLGEAYKWNSTSLYGNDPLTGGVEITTPFPHLVKIGAAYSLPIVHSSITAEYNFGPSGLSGLNGGIEYSPLEVVALRAGFSSNTQDYVGTKVAPSFGFAAKISFLDLTPEVSYAFVSEPYSPYGIQTLSVNLGF